MRIELTVRGPHGDRDIAVDAAAPARFESIAAAVCSVAGVAPDTVAWSGEQRLGPTTILGDPALRTGRVISLDGPDRSARASGVLSLHVVGGPDAGGVLALRRGLLRIGRGPECDLVLHDDRVSRVHAEIHVGGTVSVRDLGSTNGTRVDTDVVSDAPADVRAGQLIALGDSLLEVRGPDTPAAATSREAAVHVNRSPRQVGAGPPSPIVLPTPVTVRRPGRTQWLTALLPAVAGGAIAWLTHSIQFLLFTLLTPVLVLSGAMGDRLHWRRSRRREARRYLGRRAEADAAISAALADETTDRRLSAPDPAQVWRTATARGSRLWERRRVDDDHLLLRVGCGELPAAVQVTGGTGGTDGADRRSAGALPAVPVCVDLRAGPVGLSGPTDAVAGLARWLIAQLATLHSPADVEIALFLSPDRSATWSWARWLPHVGRRVAVGEDEWPALLESIVATTEYRRDIRCDPAARWGGSWYVLVLDRTAALAELAGLDTLLQTAAAVGVAALCVDTDQYALPSSCTQLVQVGGDTGAAVTVRRGNGRVDAVTDQVGAAWAEQVARELAPLVDAGDAASSVPADCGLIEVLGVGTGGMEEHAVIARWAVSDGRPVTVLGRSAAGPVVVDLLAQGPHALVAGTTGAGKSELLRSLVAGLAVVHPPEQLSFLLIDYKGGAAFAACAALPHTAGLVTDLDPHLARRALRSLDAELRRREALLAAAGVSDIESYRRGGATPTLARLIVVVDEFATLAQDVPEFVGEMVSVAQRGRSLGLHLVLATQRPGTAVTAEIRANTSLRIALRVTDPGESVQVIDVPDAARIDRAAPGRAYLRSGEELVYFQTAGAHQPVATEEPVVEPLVDWRRPTPPAASPIGSDVLAATVAAVAAAARSSGRAPVASPWMPPLPRRLELNLPDASTSTSTVAIGRLDRPDVQTQPPLELDLGSGGSVLIAGRSGSGRTSALVTVAVAAAQTFGPDRLVMYLLDAGGALIESVGALPHIGTALGPGDLTMATTLLRRMHAALSSSRASAHTADDGPLTLLLVDSWDTLLAAHDDLDAAACAEGLDALLRLGAGTGLTVVVTGGRGVLAPRLAAGFGTRLLLDLHDRADYGQAGLSVRAVPDDLPPGRGVRAGDGAEFQLAVAADPTDRVRDRWPAGIAATARTGALRLRPLPERVRLGDLARAPGRLRLGVAGDGATPVSIDAVGGSRRILVAGPPRSGRSTVLRAVLAEAVSLGLPVLVAAPARSPLAVAASGLGVDVMVPDRSSLPGPPQEPTWLLVDDSESFADTDTGDRLCTWVRADGPLSIVVAGRSDDLATAYRGIGAQVRRHRCGVLLRPGPLDGELLGVRLPRRAASGPPGRGVIIGEADWGPPFDTGEPVPIQVAYP